MGEGWRRLGTIGASSGTNPASLCPASVLDCAEGTSGRGFPRLIDVARLVLEDLGRSPGALAGCAPPLALDLPLLAATAMERHVWIQVRIQGIIPYSIRAHLSLEAPPLLRHQTV